MRRVAASARALLVVTACALVPVEPDAGDALDVQASGCASVLRGPVCEVAPGTEVRLWLPGSVDGSVRVVAAGADLPVGVTTWPDGRTLRVVVPAGASRLDVRVTGGGAREASSIVRVAAVRPVPAVLDEERALRKAGRLEDAEAVLASVSEAEAGGRSSLLSDRARLEYQQGRIGPAIADFREAIDLHDHEQHPSEAADDASALTHLFYERNRIAEARQTLAREAQLAVEYPDGLAGIVHDEGLIAWDTGDLRTALRRSREAEAAFARLGAERRRRASAVSVGLRLIELGRYAESIAIFRVLLDASDAGACERADVLDDVGWAALLSVEAGRAPVGIDAREPLAQAHELLQASCPDPNRLANVVVNLALAELQHGRVAEARKALADAKGSAHDPPIPVVLFWHHLAGRIALASREPAAALASFGREEEIAAALGSPDERLSAAEGQAAALVALGHLAQALAVLDDADSLLDQLSSSVPLGEGMDGFFATRDRAEVRRIDLLVQLGRPEQAVAAARRWRARVLTALRVTVSLSRLGAAERGRWEDAVGRYRELRDSVEEETAKDWELPSDRLAAARARREESSRRAQRLLDDALGVLPPARQRPEQPPALRPDELELLYVPSPSGWLGFARSAAQLAVQRIDRVDVRASPEDLSRALLGPFDQAIATAGRIRVLPYGDARAIDVHALPWRGRPLLEHAAVEYAVGLGDPPSPTGVARRALLVADPGGDLHAARAEADAVALALAHADWKVDDLRGAAADGEAVRAALAPVDLLHYAGHATFGGADGVDSALALARGSRLTPADVLTLPRVPAIVSLFGCDTARESVSGTLDSLGLTTAFLVDGARSVIATSRVIEDALARDVAAEFYARLGADPTADASRALRDAVLSQRDRSPGSDWAAFRVLVP